MTSELSLEGSEELCSQRYVTLRCLVSRDRPAPCCSACAPSSAPGRCSTARRVLQLWKQHGKAVVLHLQRRDLLCQRARFARHLALGLLQLLPQLLQRFLRLLAVLNEEQVPLLQRAEYVEQLLRRREEPAFRGKLQQGFGSEWWGWWRRTWRGLRPSRMRLRLQRRRVLPPLQPWHLRRCLQGQSQKGRENAGRKSRTCTAATAGRRRRGRRCSSVSVSGAK